MFSAFRSARVLCGSEPPRREGALAAPAFLPEIAFYLWAWKAWDRWFGLVDASSTLELYLLASVLQAARFLIFSKTRDAQDKPFALISCQPDVLRPCPHSSTSSAENLEPDGAAPA